MLIRHSTKEDLEEILKLYEIARETMKQNGNPNQWSDTYPPLSIIVSDIEKNVSYILEDERGILGVFSFMIGNEPTYEKIDGKWLYDGAYGTIHRVASSGRQKGILKEILKFCEELCDNIRIDTHPDNLIMQHLLEKNQYKKCGIIWVNDGSERIAYQKKKGMM